MIYNIAEGRPSDIRALTECGTYCDFLSIADNFLKRVDQHEKMVDEMKSKTKGKSNGRSS